MACAVTPLHGQVRSKNPAWFERGVTNHQYLLVQHEPY